MLSFLFQIYMAIAEMQDSGSYIGFVALLPSLFFPMVIRSILHVRSHVGTTLRNLQAEAHHELMLHADNTVSNYRMVADYFSRPLVVEECIDRIKVLNKRHTDMNAMTTNNEAFFQWVSRLIEFAWVLGGGLAVSQGMDLGSFLAILSIFGSNGNQFQVFYNTYLRVQTTYPSLWRIVKFMNLVTDLAKRRQINRKRRSQGKAKRKEIRQHSTDDTFPVDRVPLSITGLQFAYSVTAPAVIMNLSVDINQGTLVGVTGGRASGKSTFLKILGGVLPPDDGDTFVPPHLRILHLSAELQLRQEPLVDSLFFGECAAKGARKARNLGDDSLDRGWRICKKLHFPDHLQKPVEDLEKDTCGMIAALSCTDRKLLHLARALIYNPEVLVVHLPTTYFTADFRPLIMDVLREFVDERGLELDPVTKLRRRPRTCIFSTCDPSDLDKADSVLCLEELQGEGPSTWLS